MTYFFFFLEKRTFRELTQRIRLAYFLFGMPATLNQNMGKRINDL